MQPTRPFPLTDADVYSAALIAVSEKRSCTVIPYTPAGPTIGELHRYETRRRLSRSVIGDMAHAAAVACHDVDVHAVGLLFILYRGEKVHVVFSHRPPEVGKRRGPVARWLWVPEQGRHGLPQSDLDAEGEWLVGQCDAATATAFRFDTIEDTA